MERPKLILLEGFPGSGKSTMAKTLCEYYSERGIPCTFYDEVSPNNPIKMFPFYTYDFSDKKLVTDLQKHFISEWEKFLNGLKKDDAINIVDGRYIHNSCLPMYSFMAEEREIFSAFEKLTSLLSSASPSFIFLDYTSIDNFVEHLEMKRGIGWIENNVRQITFLPRYKENKIEGKTGWLKFWSDWLKVIKKLYSKSTLRKIKIEDNYKNFEENLNKTYSFLD